ncbi:MAG: cellulase family glycosylhydrolase [Ignavibacteriaceae bacterium]
MIIKRNCPLWLVFMSLTILFPAGTFASDSTVVERYGQLGVEGNRIVDKNNNPVALHGMSLFWSQWEEGSKYYNYDCIKWLRDDWKCTVVRAAMGIEMDGYLTNPELEKNKIKTVIEACIDLGIYVIIDWHDHNAHNNINESISFFREMAELYGDKPNVIYEIYNEPLEDTSWVNTIKPYADSVVSNIRSIDPDNLIIVGTPTWSQDVDIAANNPLTFNNITYALHYYAATHKQPYRTKAVTALNRGVALFVSEFGTCESSGAGVLDSNETRTWWNFLDQNKISWCNWSVADKNETASILKPGASPNGGWALSDLTVSGILVRNKIRSYNDSISTGLPAENLPINFELHQNYPNPFNPGTMIEYEVDEAGEVSIEVYDAAGQKIKTLFNEYRAVGSYKSLWNGTTDAGTKVSGGVYLFRMVFQNRGQIIKGILLN